MDAAWEAGIRWFDTADAYGGGRSEQAIGRWIAATGNRPRLTTKTFNAMDAGHDHGLSGPRIERQFESSLDRLGVARVDLYLAHEFDPDTPLGETFESFERLVESGRVGAYGVSNFSAAQLEAALRGRAGPPAPVRRARDRVPGLQPARGRVADRQVPARRAVSPGFPDGAPSGVVQTSRGRSHPHGPRPAAREGRFGDAGTCLGSLQSGRERNRGRAAAAGAPAARSRRAGYRSVCERARRDHVILRLTWLYSCSTRARSRNYST